MSDKTLSDLAREEKSAEVGTRIWTFIQAIAGPLVVASIIFLVGDRNRAWDAIDANVHAIKTHEIEGQGRHAIIERRFSQKRKELDQLTAKIDACKVEQHNLWIELAKVPEISWQNEIIQNQLKIIEVFRQSLQKEK